MANEQTIYTLDEVKKHNKKNDLWIVLHGRVLDVTSFQDEHPGGPEILLDHAGKDATQMFEDIYHSKQAIRLTAKHVIGQLAASDLAMLPAAARGPPAQQQADDGKAPQGTMASLFSAIATAADAAAAFFAPAAAAPAAAAQAKPAAAADLNLREIPMKEVKQHNSDKSLWLVLNGLVLDVTSFARDHPGGADMLRTHAGTDASHAFADVLHSQEAKQLTRTYVIGRLAPEGRAPAAPAASAAAAAAPAVAPAAAAAPAAGAITEAAVAPGGL